MSHFLLRWQFTAASARMMTEKPHDRAAMGKTLVEGFGGKLHSYFFALGDFDGVAICEFPDHVAATACSMTLASSGGFSRVETIPLLTPQEAEAAMKKARDTKTAYRAPNA